MVRKICFAAFVFWATLSRGCAADAAPQLNDIVVANDPAAPKTITVQAAAPHVTVQASPAPNVTVQAAPAPNVTVQAAPTPNVTVAAPPPANINVAPAAVNIQPAKTDWNALLTQLGTAFGTIAGAVALLTRAIKQHRASGTAENDWQDLLAYAYQFAQGDGLKRLANAAEIARKRYREQTGGDMTRTDEMDAEHGLAALHLEAQGPIKHDATEELDKQEADLTKRLNAIRAAKLAVPAAIIMVALLFCSGCEVTAKASKVNDDIALSANGAKKAYANVVDTLVDYYIANENARIESIHEAAVASHDAPTAAKIAGITKTVKLGDGSTITTADPVQVSAILDGKAKIIAALEKQRTANYAQVQNVATSMRQKLMNQAVDIDHIVALTDGLKQYFATRTNTEQTINASADEILKLATQLVPAPKPAATKKS